MEKLTIGVVILATVIGIQFYLNKPGGKEILAENAENEYDYIVVGSGSAGSVLASRLSEDQDNTVLLLEAGGFNDDPALHSPSEWPTLMTSKHAWHYYTEPQTHSVKGMNNRKMFWPRGRVLGGSSQINAMHYTRGSRFDFNEWAANGCTGWSYKDVLPYFLKSEDIKIAELKNSPYHSSGGPLAVSDGNLTPLSSLYLKAGQEMGYNVVDCNSADPVGFGEVQLNIRDGVRSSISLEFIGKAARRENLDVLINSYVTKVQFENNVAVGVSFIKNNKKHYVKARKEIIVSGGAINTPQLLMLSGIGPKGHLSDMGIPVIDDLPVGENLQDHQCLYLSTSIFKPISITPDQRDSVWTRLQYKMFGSGLKRTHGNEGTALLHSDETNMGKTYPDLQFFFLSYLLNPDVGIGGYNMDAKISAEAFRTSSASHGFTTVICLTHPKSRGTIKLRSKDPHDHPAIDPKYFTEMADVTTMIAGIRIWEKMIETQAMKDIGANIDINRMGFCEQHDFRSDDYWECVIRHVANTLYHHSGTCKMGAATDPTAVVDPQLRVKGVKGLRVVDTSVFPNLIAGNPNAPVIMTAEKAADLIRGKDTVARWRKNLP